MEGRRIGIGVLGAGGYMGKNGISALKILKEKLTEEGIDFKFLFFTETQLKKWGEIAERCNDHTEQSPIAANVLDEVLQLLDAIRKDEKYPVVIYDATPTQMHYGQMLLIHQRQDNSLVYLGEKPIFTYEHERLYVENNIDPDFKFFCELIETENPVLSGIRRYLDENPSLQIEDVKLWRAGCSGIKKAISMSRGGVEGGALEDKSLHDLSITAALLGSENILDVVVKEAEIHYLIFHPDYYEKGERTFLTSINKATKVISDDLENKAALPADGLFSLKVDWQLSGKSIPAEYLFSWLGYNEHEKELAFVSRLRSLGFDIENGEAERKWLDVSETDESTIGNKTVGSQLKEIRVGIIECSSPTGPVFIVCNFLAKYDNSNRFAYVVKMSNGGKPELVQALYRDGNTASDYDRDKAKDLASIFYRVAKDALGDEPANLIDKKTTLLIHKIMIEAGHQARRAMDTNADVWFEKMKPIFDQNITVSDI